MEAVPVKFVPRSISKPVSLLELSVQDNEMLVLESGVAARPEGAAGHVVALATFETAESPALLLARTR